MNEKGINLTTVIIGLDRELAEPIRDEIRSPQNRVYIYDTVPEGYSFDGVFHVKHPTMDIWIQPKVVVYYSYFENVLPFRKALALSNTPSYPPVRQTILHDDKELSLIYRKAINCLYPADLPRGYLPKNIEIDVSKNSVVKYGNLHCGENKWQHSGRLLHLSNDYLIEPFIEGESYRVLLIGDKAWTIQYQSEDWRKNVNSTETLISNPVWEMIYKDQGARLSLPIAGFDFILNKKSRLIDLEVNCYPGIPDFAKEKFIDEVLVFIMENCIG